MTVDLDAVKELLAPILVPTALAFGLYRAQSILLAPTRDYFARVNICRRIASHNSHAAEKKTASTHYNYRQLFLTQVC